MSGHSKWAKIKHQKAAGDAKRGQIFSKISRLITLAAKKGGDPETNLELKYAIGQARAENMPSKNIERAIKKGTGKLKCEALEKVRYEAFCPAGSAVLIEGITDNKNRTSAEIKHILLQQGAKFAEPGSAVWAFEKTSEGKWKAKNPIAIPEENKTKLKNLIDALEEHDDIQAVYTNTDINP